MYRLALAVGAASLIVFSLQANDAWANHTTVSPYLKAPAQERYYEGDRVTVLMNFSTGILAGNEILDDEGKAGYVANMTLQSIDPPDPLVRPYSIGLWVATNTLLQANFQIPIALTAGKWRITLDILERQAPESVSIFSEPQVMDFQVYPKPTAVQPDYGTVIGILGILATVGTPLFLYWRKKSRSGSSQPVIQWEWFQEKTSGSGLVSKIRIRMKEGHAERVRVYTNGYQLTWEKNGQKEFNMSGGDAGNLIIPPEHVFHDSGITLRWDKHGERKERLGNIPKASD